jgi:hypothetical protein
LQEKDGKLWCAAGTSIDAIQIRYLRLCGDTCYALEFKEDYTGAPHIKPQAKIAQGERLRIGACEGDTPKRLLIIVQSFPFHSSVQK